MQRYGFLSYICTDVIVPFMKIRLSAIFLAVFVLGLSASAQDRYLMPEFRKGTVFFRGQAPAKGLLNISAQDHTLRFLDKDGTELAARDEANIVKVIIDTVQFLRSMDQYYRLYPVKADIGVAALRTVTVQRDLKQGAYGTTSQTTSVQEYSSIYADGVQHSLEVDKNKPYKVSETIFLYKGGQIHPLSRRGLKKVFPDSRELIDAYFKAGGSVPETVPEAVELLGRF